MHLEVDRFQQLRNTVVAIAADDPCIARVLGNYLLDHDVFAQCAAYRRGRDLLSAMQEGAEYSVIVLDERLQDQDVEEFVQSLAKLQLPLRPAIFVLTRYRYLELCETLSRYGSVRCLARMNDPDRLVRAIHSWFGSFAAQLPALCQQQYRQWGVDNRRRDCAYLTDAVTVVLENPHSALLRKQVLADVAARHGVEPSAVESGLQRMIRALNDGSGEEYPSFLQRHTLQQTRVTPIRLINALAEELSANLPK